MPLETCAFSAIAVQITRIVTPEVLRLSRNDHSQIRLIVTDLLFIMSPVRKEKTSESFVILRIILSEAGHQTVISITDYELVEIKKIVKKDKDGNEKSETLFGRE